MNRQDFKDIAHTRLRESKALLASRNYSGAYYLAGYVIECALKACIAKQTKRFEFPDKKKIQDSYTHDLGKLLDLAGLKSVLEADAKANRAFGSNWAVVDAWSEESRYRSFNGASAQELYDAISDPATGVLSWIMRHW